MKRDLNFFSIYHESTRKALSQFSKLIITVLVMILIILAIFTGLTVSKFMAAIRVNQIKSYLLTTTVTNANSLVTKDSTKLGKLAQYRNTAKNLTDAFNSQQFIDSDFFSSITRAMPSDTKASNIAYSKGFVVFSCSSQSVMSAAKFQASLQKLGLFSQIYYSNVTQLSPTGYTFTMTCELKTGGAK